MDTKVVTDVVCIHCGTTIRIQKRKTQEQCKLACPGCKRSLHILFNINDNPQTYSFLSASQITKEVKEEERPEEKEMRKAQKDKTIYRKDRHVAHSYDDKVPGEDDDDTDDDRRHRSGSPKLRENLFLTRRKFFGLVAERYKLSEGKTIVGRADDEEPSDISLTGDDTISRRSISIEIVPDDYGFDYILRVLNASNPVRVNGKQIRQGEKTYLDPGDIITVGHTDLKFDNQ
ncbi:MAG: FHA domain-containing protein [Bacteroidaceae bacterium]|nr:FHA domain-containing protein [Bacteroidaceae bacterium]